MNRIFELAIEDTEDQNFVLCEDNTVAKIIEKIRESTDKLENACNEISKTAAKKNGNSRWNNNVTIDYIRYLYYTFMDIFAGQVFENCVIFDDNEFAWFLEHPDDYKELVYYDIVMPKEGKLNDIKYKGIGKGSKTNIKVDRIHIAEDGTPGVFVYIP